MRRSLIVAVAENGVIGRGGRLPWRLPDDLRRFKEITWGGAIIMGRRTYESIGRPLPGRLNIVLTRRSAAARPGVQTAATIAEALELAAERPEAFFIGGAQVYAAALPLVQRIYMTVVHARPEGDVRFPEWTPSQWRLVREERREADARHAHAFTFRVFDRREGGEGA